jgi:hypothetical protein
MYSPRDQAVIDAEPAGAGVRSEAVEIFRVLNSPRADGMDPARHILLTIR